MIAKTLWNELLWTGISCAVLIAFYFAGARLGWDPSVPVIVVASIAAIVVGTAGFGEKPVLPLEFAMQWLCSIGMFVDVAMASRTYVGGSLVGGLIIACIALYVGYVSASGKRRTYKYLNCGILMPVDVIAVIFIYKTLPAVGLGAFFIKGSVNWLLAPIVAFAVSALLTAYCLKRLPR